MVGIIDYVMYLRRREIIDKLLYEWLVPKDSPLRCDDCGKVKDHIDDTMCVSCMREIGEITI